MRKYLPRGRILYEVAIQELRPLDEREMGAWHALIRAHSRIVRRLEAELEAEHGLSLPAYEVLAHLSMAPDQRLRMSELAEHAVLTPERPDPAGRQARPRGPGVPATGAAPTRAWSTRC